MEARAKCDSLRDMKHGTWAQWHSLGKSLLEDSRFDGCTRGRAVDGTRRPVIAKLRAEGMEWAGS